MNITFEIYDILRFQDMKIQLEIELETPYNSTYRFLA